ncbi:hypothetical protein HYPSUDRAFT_199053 [Hypholoma sublateritium FD-334 SS-4]|uniref:Uncharacterized protein n=1 Tax=Hypholoma sublateritium (strain FD-334 SS-4) TaxID=945553 RepID=A0A0D2PCL4_HYPSF|nr:hypothetical protein HYPSUDRAFT_199053 [Hypholoma sublateritium FD-334 SS-4]
MKSAFAPVAAALLLASNAMAQLTVNTPLSAVVCQPLLITWSGGTPPYFLPSAAALLSFPSQTTTSITWTVNITANTQLGLDLKDSTGTLAQSGVFTTQAGSDTSCLTGTSSTTGTGSTSGTTTSTGVTTAPGTTSTSQVTVATSTTPGTTSSVSTTAKVSTTSAAATSTTSTSSAAGNMANAALAGAFGIGAALLGLAL